MRKYLLFGIAFIFTFSLIWAAMAVAQDQTLAEKLLVILKANHQITQQQYDELLKEAEKEKTAQKATVAKQVKAETVQAAKEYKESHPLNVYASWKHHEMYFESNDGNFTMHVGGYAQIDFGGADVNDALRDVLPKLDGYGAEARRARLTVEGTLYSDIGYKAQFDFAGGKTVITDLFMTYKDIPCIGTIKVGHQKEPFSLEALTASSWFQFMERSPAFTFISEDPSGTRNTGVQLYDQEFGKRMTWAIGGFIQQSISSGNSFQDFDNTNFAARVTALPWYADDGCQLVHLGFGFRHLFRSANPENADLVFKSSPEFHLPGVNTVNSGALAADGVNMVNPEAAIVYGPFSVQGEYFASFLHNAFSTKTTSGSPVTGVALGNPEFNGYYVFASWFLTGEHRMYNRNYGIFGRTIPCHNFSLTEGGWGAWELAVRYSNIDLNDSLVTGGKEDDVTAGINWYLNPNVRWTFNYIYAHVDGELLPGDKTINDGDANIFASRFQVNF